MSKNFELLYQTGKAQEMLQVDAQPESSPLAPSEQTLSTPALEIEGMAREELSKLVHRLFLMPGTEGPRHVVFAGTESGTGCSWTCAHAAEILASQVRDSVCIVDCNLTTPSLHRQFGVENHFGLADALTGAGPVRQYARQLSRQNLWFVSCGAIDAGSGPLLASDRMRGRITELRSEFEPPGFPAFERLPVKAELRIEIVPANVALDAQDRLHQLGIAREIVVEGQADQ